MLLPFSADIKVQQTQREQMAVMGFLASLPSEFDTTKSQILSSFEISSLQETFNWLLRTKSFPSIQMSNALVSKNSNYEPVKQQTKSSGSALEPPGQSSRGVVCYYCHKPGHTRRECRKLLNQNRRFQFAHVMFASNTLERSVVLSAYEYAMLLKPASTPTIALAELGKPDTCCMSSSSNRVIDSGATDHMTGNFSLFTTFQSHPSSSIVTLADGSKSCVLEWGTINHTPLIPLTYVISLPHFSFNLISVSKVTRTLNCSISFFPGYSLFRDLLTKRVIDRGQESRASTFLI